MRKHGRGHWVHKYYRLFACIAHVPAGPDNLQAKHLHGDAAVGAENLQARCLCIHMIDVIFYEKQNY